MTSPCVNIVQQERRGCNCFRQQDQTNRVTSCLSEPRHPTSIKDMSFSLAAPCPKYPQQHRVSYLKRYGYHCSSSFMILVGNAPGKYMPSHVTESQCHIQCLQSASNPNHLYQENLRPPNPPPPRKNSPHQGHAPKSSMGPTWQEPSVVSGFPGHRGSGSNTRPGLQGHGSSTRSLSPYRASTDVAVRKTYTPTDISLYTHHKDSVLIGKDDHSLCSDGLDHGTYGEAR